MKKIALIAPSSPAPDLTPETISSLSDLFADIGLQIHLGSHALDSTRFLAGSDADRATDIMRAFTDKNIDAVMTIRGGYGSPRLLDRLDYDTLRRNKKPFWTISDGTALQTALYHHSGITGFSGMQALFMLNPDNKHLIKTVALAFQNKLPPIPIQKTFTAGHAEGIMIGGNLTVFTALLGTPYFPDMTDKILVMEDINEYPYRLDRMLAQLRLAGVFKQVKGVVLGDFSACLSKDPDDGTADDVFKDYFTDASFPVVQINYGHRNRETVVPIGTRVSLDSEAGILQAVS